MKYAIIADNGRKRVTIASDDYIDLDITEGNRRIFTLTLRNGKLYDQHDNEIGQQHVTVCENHDYYRTNCPQCKEINN